MPQNVIIYRNIVIKHFKLYAGIIYHGPSFVIQRFIVQVLCLLSIFTVFSLNTYVLVGGGADTPKHIGEWECAHVRVHINSTY